MVSPQIIRTIGIHVREVVLRGLPTIVATGAAKSNLVNQSGVFPPICGPAVKSCSRGKDRDVSIIVAQ